MATNKRSKRTSRSTAALPGWGDLSREQKSEGRWGTRFAADLSTPRFVLLVLAVAGACALYVGHVHATQALLSKVERARTENQRLHLKNNRLQSAFDEATAPAVIYRRADELGLKEGLSRGPAIYVGGDAPAPR
jgi:hypothetical protein